MQRLSVQVLALCLALCLLLGTTASAANDFKQEALNGVVVVYEDILYSATDGENYYELPDESGRGTGFFVGETGKDPQYLVTNWHVVERYIKAHEMADYTDPETGLLISGKPSRLYVRYDEDDDEEAYLVEYHEDMDIAILRLDRPTDKRVPIPLQIPTSDMIGDSAYALGYPAAADYTIQATSSAGIEDVSVTGGSISRLLTESGTGRKLVQMDVPIYSGNSGGPLISKAGGVLGVNTNGSKLAESMNYALSVEELIPLLDRNNVAYSFVPSGPPILPIAAGAGAAIVVLAVVLLIVLRKRKGKAEKARKQTEKTDSGAEPAKLRGYVRSMAAQHRGLTIELSATPVLIGRDTSAGICYEERTPGVSSRHCTLAWDAARGEFLLTDTGSTYGTFLTNGQRLASGVAVRLRAGDSFYLGDRANELRLEVR